MKFLLRVKTEHEYFSDTILQKCVWYVPTAINYSLTIKDDLNLNPLHK